MWIRCPNKLKEMQEGSNHNNRVRVNYQALLQCTVTEEWEGWVGGGGLYQLLGKGNMRKTI